MTDSLHDLVESAPEQIATGFAFTEGPVWDPRGFVLFTEIGDPHEIWKVVPGQEKELVRENTGRATGLTFDLQGRLIACEQVTRQVTRMDAGGTVTPIATHFDDKRLNRPNDVVGTSDGSLYFTNRGAAGLEPEERDLEHNGVYRIAPDGEVHQVVCPYVDPNGLAFSPDEKTFYLVNTRPDALLDAFDVEADGSLSNQRRFFDFPDTGEPGVPDGVKVDVEGRVYCTGPGGIYAIDPDGTSLGVIRLPEQAVNMGWGGEDNRTLFVGAMTSVYSLRMKTAGTPIPKHR